MLNTNKSFNCIDEWLISNTNLPHESSLRIMQLNIRSMNNVTKFDSIKEVLHRFDRRVDIIVLGETWIQQDRVCLFNIAGYKSMFSCRNESNGAWQFFTEMNSMWMNAATQLRTVCTISNWC